MLLQGIREQATGWIAWVIVILISVPFALWGIQEYLGVGGQVIVAKINDQSLDKEAFDKQVSNQMQRLASMGNEIDVSAFETKIKQDTLKRMINEELLLQTAHHHQLRVGNALLEARIHGMSFFQENGRFSKDLYEQRVRMQYSSPIAFEQELRRDLLARQLEEGLSSSALLSSVAKKEYEQLDNQQRLISYVVFPATNFAPGVTVSEAEIQSYYDAHHPEFFTEEKVSVDYVLLDKAKLNTAAETSESLLKQRYEQQKAQYTTETQWRASHILIPIDGDATSAKQQAETLLQRVKSGEDFAALAKEFSKDTGSSAKGGDLDFFSAGQMVAPFEAAVKTLKVGEISNLVESRFGFHIIKLTEIKPESTKPFAEVREELVKQVQAEEAQARFDSLVDEFSNLAFEKSDSLDPIVSALGLEKLTTGLFTRQGEKEGLFANPKVLEAVFNNNVLQEGKNSEVIELEDERLMVLRVKQLEKSVLQALEAVKGKITGKLRTEKSRAQAADLGKKLLSAVRQQKNWQALLTAQNLHWETAVWVSRRGTEPAQPQVRDAAFKVGTPAPGQALYQSLELPTGDYAVLAVLAVKTPESQKAATPLLTQQEQALGQTEFNAFLAGLKEQADIKVFDGRI